MHLATETNNMIKFANSIVRPVLALLGLSVLLAVSAQAQVI